MFQCLWYFVDISTWAWTLLLSASWLFRSEQIDWLNFKSTLHTWTFSSQGTTQQPPCPDKGWSQWCCGGQGRKTSGPLEAQGSQEPSTPNDEIWLWWRWRWCWWWWWFWWIWLSWQHWRSPDEGVDQAPLLATAHHHSHLSSSTLLPTFLSHTWVKTA